jgi:hypothetical protein
MKTRFVPLVGLAISFALPTYAQQKEVADPQTTQSIAAILKAFSEAHMNNDAGVFVYARGANHRPASPSEMAHRPVPMVAPKRPHHQDARSDVARLHTR